MCFAVYCRRSSITRFHRNGESTPPCGHPRLVLIRLVAFLCVMVTCRLVTMFLIQPAVDESRGDWSIASGRPLCMAPYHNISITKNCAQNLSMNTR